MPRTNNGTRRPAIQVGLDWYAGSDRDFDLLFTIDILMIPACRGYPWLIHRLTYRGNSDEYLGVLGNREGTTTTPLDMVILIDHDQFDLVMDDIDCVPSLGCGAATVHPHIAGHRPAICAHTCEDTPTVACWTWPEAH